MLPCGTGKRLGIPILQDPGTDRSDFMSSSLTLWCSFGLQKG